MVSPRIVPFSIREFIPGKAAKPFEDEQLTQTSFRPTIIIGLGGTGLAVVRRLKKLLRRYYRGEKKEIFQFITFDTTSEEVPEGEEPLDAGEFVYLGAFDAADMIRHLDENKYIASWWPGGVARPYRPTFSGTGASRVRAVGRLVLFNFIGNTIIPRLEAKIDRAIEMNAQHGIGATSLKFYIVGSLAGGTCSGMILDMAYIARMLGLRTNFTAFVTGVMVLDDAFTPKAHTENARASFRANTLAALMEINHFSRTRKFLVNYSDLISTSVLPVGHRPFDVSYLVGLHNAQGQALASFDALADMVAAEMMLEIASRLQGHHTNVLDNVNANDNSIAGQPASYSSFVVTSLAYPLAGISSWCGLRALKKFSEQVMLHPRQPVSEVSADVVAFFQKAAIEEEQADSLTERLNRDDKGEEMPSPAISHDQVNGLPEPQLMGALQRLEESALANLGVIREQIAKNVQPARRKFREDLTAEVTTILRDPRRGPQYLAWFLTEMCQRLAAQREQQMIAEQSLFSSDADGQAAAWRAAKENLASALRLSRALPWRAGKLNSARSVYGTAFNAYISAVHELEKRTQAIACMNLFLEEARKMEQAANDLVRSWEDLARLATEQAEKEATQEHVVDSEFSLVRNVIGSGELQQTYEALLPSLDKPEEQNYWASQFWQFFDAKFPGWSLASASEQQVFTEDITNPLNPSVQVYYFLAQHYAEGLGNKSLIDRLKEIYGEDWTREIELRSRQTAPFWSLNLSRFMDRIRDNLQDEPRLVGYGEPNISRWSGLVSHAIGNQVDGVNNNNPHEMIFLQTSHGLPLFALRPINQTMLTAYNYLRRLWMDADGSSNPVPVHISSEWEIGMRDLEPQKEGKSPTPSATPSNSNGSEPEPESTVEKQE